MSQILKWLSGSRMLIPSIMAIGVGIGTGLISVIFIHSIDWMSQWTFASAEGAFGALGRFSVVFVPAIGGLFVGCLVTFLAPEAKGHGVPQVLKAIAMHHGKIRPIVVLIKAVASALSIGTGASVGREGPIVQVGSALGSNIGSFFKLGELRRKNLIACGAAAGIASVFNAPIAGVIFSSEVILRDFGARALSTVVISAVSGSVISRMFLGETPAFVPPSYSLINPMEIFLYITLGILSAYVAHLFIHTLHRSEDIFEKWKFPEYLKAAVGGLIIGLIGVYFPHVFGSGLSTIESALHGMILPLTLLALVFVKIIGTSISLGSGSSGGVFAPALFIGSALGGAFGGLFEKVIPFGMAPKGAYAVVGMASVFAAAAHAPITAILIVFEMTGDYRLILPLMTAVVVATTISQAIDRDSIYTMRFKQQGLDLRLSDSARVLGAVQVRDAMTKSFVTVPDNIRLSELIEKIPGFKNKVIYAVDNYGRLEGKIRPEDVQKAIIKSPSDLPLPDDLIKPIYDHFLPEETLMEAAKLLSDQDITDLPVLENGDPSKIIGILKSENVLKTYADLTSNAAELNERVERSLLAEQGIIETEIRVPSNAKIVNLPIRAIQLPGDLRFVSIKRGRKQLVPVGETVIQSKDVIEVRFQRSGEAAFKQWLQNNKLQ